MEFNLKFLVDVVTIICSLIVFALLLMLFYYSEDASSFLKAAKTTEGNKDYVQPQNRAYIVMGLTAFILLAQSASLARDFMSKK